MQYVVIVGTLFAGIQTVHGPFKTEYDACHWALAHAYSQEHQVYAIREPS